MPRRPLVIAILALLAVVVAVPVLLLQLAERKADPAPAGASQEAVAVEALRAADVEWAYAAPLFAAPVPNVYTLQAGVLGEARPLVDLQVPFGIDPNSNPGRVPAVGRVVNGSVVHVADDGAHSALRRVAVARNAVVEELAVLDEIVYSLAVAPDGAHAYLALGDRADPELDRGIVRVSLDGQARIEQVFDPAAAARSEPAIVPAAIAPFQVQVGISPDGDHLTRFACAGPAGCAAQVIDLATGQVTAVGAQPPLGVAGGIAVIQECAAECTVALMDLSSGAVERLPGVNFGAEIALVDGRPRVAFVEVAADIAVLRALDPSDGSVVEVIRAPAGSSLTLGMSGPAPGIGWPGPGLSLPEGYVLAEVSGEEAGAIIEMHTIAIRLDGGDTVELPPQPIRREFGGMQG